MLEPARKKASSRKGDRHGDPSWSEAETDRLAAEATDRALGILARWLIRAAQGGPSSKDSGGPAQNPPTPHLFPPAPRGKGLD